MHNLPLRAHLPEKVNKKDTGQGVPFLCSEMSPDERPSLCRSMIRCTYRSGVPTEKLSMGGIFMSKVKQNKHVVRGIEKDPYCFPRFPYEDEAGAPCNRRGYILQKACPVCGRISFSCDDCYEFCKCGWQENRIQELFPDDGDCANKMSLNEARKAYKEGKKVH